MPYHNVTQEDLQAKLRIGPDAFTYAIMIPQYGKAFFELAPGDKLTLFSNVMELDYWLTKSQEAALLAKAIELDRGIAERGVAHNTGRLETIAADIASLTLKNKSFSDAEAERVKSLKYDLAAAQKRLDNAFEAEAFAIKALWGVKAKLARAEQGAKKCPTCGTVIANKDLESLHTNLSDFERQLRKVEREKDLTLNEMGLIKTAMQPRENPYAEQIADKHKDEKQTREKLKTLKGEIDTLTEDHAAVSYWVLGFKRVRLFIIEETLRQLELEINNSLTSLGLIDWSIELDVERENKSGGITKGFTVLIHAPGAPGPVKFESWSGGETQRLCLAGDLGLANLIMERAGLRSTIEFFDEPSRHLSNAGILDLAETLHQRAKEQDKRCFVIEHNLLDYPYTGAITVVKDATGSHIEPN